MSMSLVRLSAETGGAGGAQYQAERSSTKPANDVVIQAKGKRCSDWSPMGPLSIAKNVIKKVQ